LDFSQTLTFNGEDTKTTPMSFVLGNGGTCTVKETESAGATSITYKCDKIEPDDLGITCTENADGIEVIVPESVEPGDEATVFVTVTNDFTPPPPPSTETPTTAAAPTTAAPPAAPPPVEAAPVFTG
jgi:hypothetical protein